MRFSKCVMYLFLVIGFALLSVIIWQVGFVGLLESFYLMGLWHARRRPLPGAVVAGSSPDIRVDIWTYLPYR
jgi:hypothetical protein